MYKNILLVFLIIILGSCAKEESKEVTASKKPLVLVSIPTYSYFVKKIAGDSVQVATLIPTGSDPHAFEPNYKQMEVALDADLWFYIGDGLERKIMSVLKEKKAQTTFCDLRQNIELLPVDETNPQQKDGHLWMSPKIAKQQAKIIATALRIKYPQNIAIYRKNLQNFLKELSSLENEVGAILEKARNSAILVSHPAFTYLCKEYNIKQLSLEYEGQDVDSKHLGEIYAEVQKRGVHKVIMQSNHNNKGASLIAKNLSLEVALVDPYSADYVNNIRYMAKVIAESQ